MTVRRFLADTRGAAGLAAAFLSVMFLSGAALIVDHVWLVGQRDVMKNATDAATIAATLEMQKHTGTLSEEERKQVAAVAERWALLNIVGNIPSSERSRARESLSVEVPERAGGVVEVTVSADLGGTLLSERLLDYAGPESITQRAGVQPSIQPTELVLAVDVSRSMERSLSGGYLAAGHKDSRMEIVKKAALDLLDVLAAAGTGDNAPLAIGVVPWTHAVRLGATARTKWKKDGWATFPTEHDYPHPPAGKGPATPAHSVRQTLPAQSSLGSSCRAWAGCLEPRASSVAKTALPSASPFLMRFFSPQSTYSAPRWYVSFGCQNYRDRDARRNGWRLAACYDWSRMTYQTDYNKCINARAYSGSGAPIKIAPQEQCSGQAEILPLTTDLEAARTAVRALAPVAGSTNSSLAATWAQRLLAPTWRAVWGDSVHPMASTEGQTLKKVLVLLTDGEDNHPDSGGADARRSAACTAIKNAGVQVFTIAAMNTSAQGQQHLAAQLRACSSQADDPNGTYVFVNNATPENLAQAFREIGRQLLVMRRVY